MDVDTPQEAALATVDLRDEDTGSVATALEK